MPFGQVLLAYADAAVAETPDLALRRQTVADTLGHAAMVDASAVIAIFQAVVKIADATGIPLDTPSSSTTSAPAVRGTYKGFISHYHLKKNKIDCAGLDLKQLITDINEGDY